MRKVYEYGLFLASLCCVTLAQATDGASQPERIAMPAAALNPEMAMAPIRSQRDLYEHLASLQQSNSPLRRLSPAARARFVRSLQFNEKGLTSADTKDLVAELSAADVYRVLRLFGAQHLTTKLPGIRFVTAEDRTLLTASWGGDDLCNIQMPDGAGCTGDYPGYYCEAKGTCRSSPGYICTRNC